MASDISKINDMLKNSFSAIKCDMESLKRAQLSSSSNIEYLKEELASFRRLAEDVASISSLKKRVEAVEVSISSIAERTESVESSFSALIDAVNERLEEVNQAIRSVSVVRDEISDNSKRIKKIEKKVSKL